MCGWITSFLGSRAESESWKQETRSIGWSVNVFYYIVFRVCTHLENRIREVVRKKKKKDQANKSTGRMPRRQEPKKDVASCEKLRVAASRRESRRYPNGGTRRG